jgi:hypothetical protein
MVERTVRITESREVRRLGQGRVGLIRARLGPRGVGSMRGTPTPTRAVARRNLSRRAGIGRSRMWAQGSVGGRFVGPAGESIGPSP